MFTGLIEEVGKVLEIKPSHGGIKLKVSANKVIEDTQIGDSIAVNGVCLTVVEMDESSAVFDVSPESLNRSTFKHVKVGDFLNLERAMRPSDRLGGHIVQGHVDAIGRINSIASYGEHTQFVISFPFEYQELVVEKGSIAIDGISLTINEIKGSEVFINIIPHTIKSTNLAFKKIGDLVNIEFDVIGKYVAKMLQGYKENRLEKLLRDF